MVYMPLPNDPELRLEYLNFYLEVYKAIGVAFLVTVLGAIIPQIVPEAKFTFDNIVKGREHYTKAKTGIDYLPYRLPYYNMQEALAHIETIHQTKHLADIYIKEPYRVAKWPYDPYERIVVYRTALINCSSWDNLPVEKRLEVMQSVEVK